VLLKRRRRTPDSGPVASRTVPVAACLALLAQIVFAGPPVARAQAGPTCERVASTGPVSLIILQSAKRVRDLAATVRGAEIVEQDAATVVFSDGRVITSDLASATRHLNALGWGSRSIEVVASFPARSARRRSFG